MDVRQLELQVQLAHEPENINLWVEQGLLFERLGNWENAYTCYRQVSEIHSSPVSDALLERIASKWLIPPQIERYLLELALDADNFRLAWEALLRMGPRVVTRLIQELHNTDFTAKERIITLLGRLKDPRATLPLLEYLPYYPIPVIQALRCLRDERSVPKLTKLYYQQESPLIRRMVVWALGRISGPSSLHLLLYAGWKDENHAVRIEARECLEDLAHTDPKLATKLLLFFHEEDMSIRLGALWTLSHLPQETGYDLVLRTLQDSSYEVRELAVDILGKWQKIEAIPALMQLLQHEEKLTQAILEALGKIGYRPPLREALRDPDPWKKFLGAKLLFQLGEAPGRFMLELLSKHIDRRLSWAAKQTLKWGY